MFKDQKNYKKSNFTLVKEHLLLSICHWCVICSLRVRGEALSSEILERKQVWDVKAIVQFAFVCVPPPSFSRFILIHGIAM